MEYEGGTINDVRATAKSDKYNPQFLLDETYFHVWGDGYRQWFRSKANNKRLREDKQKAKANERGRKSEAEEKEKEANEPEESNPESVAEDEGDNREEDAESGGGEES